MRGATQFARRLKQLFRSLRGKHGKVAHPPTGDPVSQLVLGVLTRDVAESRAREALEKLRAMVVDYNELRVVSPLELAETLSGYPDARVKTEDISRALNRIFAIEHTVSLDRLTDMSVKDSRTYLDRIDGLEAYTRARVRLFGLNQHAVPLDEAMLAFVRQENIVDPQATHEEIQSFLERQVDHAESLEFFSLLRKHAWSEMAAAIRKGKVEKLRSIPPDRTSRNMLQLITPASLSGAEEEPEDAPLPPAKAAGRKAGRADRATKADRPATGKTARPGARKAATEPAAAPPAKPAENRRPAASKEAAAVTAKRSPAKNANPKDRDSRKPGRKSRARSA